MNSNESLCISAISVHAFEENEFSTKFPPGCVYLFNTQNVF